PQNASTKPNAYEVVSIKPSKPGSPGSSEILPNGFRDTETTIGDVMRNAFGIFYDKQIIGMPPWTESELYDIEAKVDADTATRWQRLTSTERRNEERSMMQALLIDRCKLKFHFVRKEMQVYDLMIANSRSKMKEAPQDEAETGGMAGGDGVTFTAHALSIENFIPTLSGTDGRLVVDKTGLGNKRFDFTLHWSPGAGSGPSLFTALEEQLGLKLVPSKETVHVLVIDQMEKPSPN
ncbi:MAG TPA: TIGR03435 family protein, partial [Terracidiphilus sp.]